MLKRFARTSFSLSALVALAACGGDAPAGGLTGSVEIDGSSTVFPIMEAVVEDFQIANRGVRVTVGISGTGGGFRRFCAGETDVSDASRPVKDTERDECAAAGIEFTEIPIAWDGLSVIVSPENTWANCMTVDELRRIWEPGSTVRTWADVREGFPAEPISLYGPGTSSGTFDYFTEAIVGEGGASRPDYQASEDDNVLVTGVSGDAYSLGYFGYAYYIENQDRLKVVQIDGGNGCVAPSQNTIESGTYAPLSRPLYIYVSHASVQRPEVSAFLDYVIEYGPEVIPTTGYIALTPAQYAEQATVLAGLAGTDH